MKRIKSHDNPAAMRLECIMAGAYYWLRAEGNDENMVSAMNRLKYRQLVERFDILNIPRPTPEEIYAYAAEKWPQHKLHPAPRANARPGATSSADESHDEKEKRTRAEFERLWPKPGKEGKD